VRLTLLCSLPVPVRPQTWADIVIPLTGMHAGEWAQCLGEVEVPVDHRPRPHVARADTTTGTTPHPHPPTPHWHDTTQVAKELPASHSPGSLPERPGNFTTSLSSYCSKSTIVRSGQQLRMCLWLSTLDCNHARERHQSVDDLTGIASYTGRCVRS
jgi:hypothetical protein